MDWSNIRWEQQQGYPLLRVTIDRQEAVITTDQKPTLLEMQAVYLGSEFDQYRVEIPADPAIAREATTIVGAVRNERFWREVFLPFITAVNDGSFAPKVLDS